MMPKALARGVTLVEAMVAVAVLGIVAAIAVPSFTDMVNRRRVQAVATNISTDLAFLRAESGLRPRHVIAYFNMTPGTTSMSCYTIGVLASTGNCNCTASPICSGGTSELKTERTPLANNVSYMPAGAWAIGGTGRLDFYNAKLVPMPNNFRVDVCGSPSATVRPVLRVELNAAGRAKICSPNNSMSGYGACTSAAAATCAVNN